MHSTRIHTIYWGSLAFLLLIAAMAASWFHLYWLLGIPVVLVGALFMLQYPQILFYLLMASIPWSVEFQSGSLGTDLPDEPIMLLCAFATIALMVYKRKDLSPRKAHPLIQLQLVQFTWIVITAALSSFALISWKYTLAKSWYLLAFIGLPLFLFNDRKVLIRSLLILMGSMLLLMMVSLIRHNQYGFSFEKTNTALEPFFRNHVNYSALLVLMIPIVLALLKWTNGWTRWFWRAVLLVTIAAIYLSYARGAWLALIAGLVAYWLIKKRLLVKSYILFLVFLVASVLVLKHNDRYLAFSHDYKTTIFHTNFKEHLVATYQFKDVSTAERYYRWIAGVRMIPDSWQTGFGPSTFYHNYKSYTVPAFKTWVSNNLERSTVHNYYLLLIIEQGLIGLLLFLSLLGGLFYYAQKIYHQTRDPLWRTIMAGVASMLVMISTVNFLSDLIETDKVGSIFYLCFSVIIAAALAHQKKEVTP